MDCMCTHNMNASCVFCGKYNLELIRCVCCVFISHKSRAAVILLPMADETDVRLANCDYSFAKIWRDFFNIGHMRIPAWARFQ